MRLRNGLFLITSRFRKGNIDYPFEQLANLIYGPSYVSLEWALSFYGFIPERVALITNVTTGSNKEFTTPIGHFSYHHLSKSRYCHGMDHHSIADQIGGFLIATPEKALADWVHLSCQKMNERELLQNLTEGKRIELEHLHSLNKERLAEIAQQYHSTIITTLNSMIRKL